MICKIIPDQFRLKQGAKMCSSYFPLATAAGGGRGRGVSPLLAAAAETLTYLAAPLLLPVVHLCPHWLQLRTET
jgi:hypothetical protein